MMITKLGILYLNSLNQLNTLYYFNDETFSIKLVILVVYNIFAVRKALFKII